MNFLLPSPPPPSGSGLPHPPQGAVLGNSWERVRRRLKAAGLAVIKSLSHLQQVGPEFGLQSGRAGRRSTWESDILTQRGARPANHPPRTGWGRGKQKPATQQWQTDLLLHKKQRLTLEKCVSYLLTKYSGHNFRRFGGPCEAP